MSINYSYIVWITKSVLQLLIDLEEIHLDGYETPEKYPFYEDVIHFNATYN